MAQPAHADEDLGEVWGGAGRPNLRLIAGGAGKPPPDDDGWSGPLVILTGLVLGVAVAHCLLPWIRLALG